MSVEKVKDLDILVVAGSGSKDFKITDELLREHQLAPPLNAEIIKGEHIEV